MYEFDATLWLWRDTWHFVTLPEEVTDDIEDSTPLRGGFGSVKVEVTFGSTTWRTSIFPNTDVGSFMLPVKKAVRTAQQCEEGDTIRVRLRVNP